MEILYAIPLTLAEKNRYFNSFKEKTRKENHLKEVILNKYHNELIAEYIRYDEQMKSGIIEEIRDFLHKKQAQREHKCTCGASIRFVESHGFWGCVNYRDNSVKHEVFEGREVYRHFHYRNRSYLTEIIQRLNLTGKINAKKLALFYQSQGLDDLLIKHRMGNAMHGIQAFQRVKKVSDSYEKDMFNELKDRYEYAYQQFGIKYKLSDNPRQKYCFLDILASNEKEVVIYECKTHDYNKDADQMELYIALMEFIERKKKNRPVRFEYLIQNPSYAE